MSPVSIQCGIKKEMSLCVADQGADDDDDSAAALPASTVGI